MPVKLGRDQPEQAVNLPALDQEKNNAESDHLFTFLIVVGRKRNYSTTGATSVGPVELDLGMKFSVIDSTNYSV